MNKLRLTITKKIKDKTEYFLLFVSLNGKSLKLFKHKNVELTKFNSYRLELLEYFLGQELSHFILLNYIDTNNELQDLDYLETKYSPLKAKQLMVFRVKLGINYYNNMLKAILQKLKNTDSFTCILHNELKDFTVENLVELETYMDDLSLYIDYKRLELDNPEFYI